MAFTRSYDISLDTPPEFQWDPDSVPNQSTNCGPTTITHAAVYYKDNPGFRINTTRRLAGVPDGRGTSAGEQALMLQRRDVPCRVVGIDTLDQLRDLVRSGRRPVVIGVLMSRVPAAIRDHPFLGWHALAVRDHDAGDKDFTILDPNFNREWRRDPDWGRKRYPDHVLRDAFVHNPAGAWAIVPTRPKPHIEGPYLYVHDNAPIRATRWPDRWPRIYGRGPAGPLRMLQGTAVVGGTYTYRRDGVFRTDDRWAKVRYQGHDAWVGWLHAERHVGLADDLRAANEAMAAEDLPTGLREATPAEAADLWWDEPVVDTNKEVGA